MRLKICRKKCENPINLLKNVCQTRYVPILAFLSKSDIFKYKIGHHNTTQPPGNLPERCRAKGMAVLLGQPRSGELPWESSVSKLKQKQKETEQRTAEPRNAAGPMEDMYSSQPLENRDQTWKITSQTLHLAFRFHLFSMFILLFKAFRAMKHFFQSPGLRTAHSRRSQWLNSPMGPISKVGKFWSTSSSKTELERISWTIFGGCFFSCLFQCRPIFSNHQCAKKTAQHSLCLIILFPWLLTKPVNHKSISYRFHPCASMLASSCPKLRGTLIAPSVPPSIDQPQAKRLRLTTKFPENPPQFLLFPLRSWSFIVSKYDESPLQVETSWK